MNTIDLRHVLRRIALTWLALAASSAVLAEGSRTLMPSTYTAGRATLNLRNAGLYAGVAQERQFLYVYAEAGEYILVGTSNRATVSGTVGNGDVLVYAPPPGGFGARGNETRPATAALACSSATAPAGSFTGAGRGIIGSRPVELAGPNSADGSVAVTNGFNPCAYRVPTTGIYGVQFTGAANGSTGDPANTGLTAWQLLQNHVLAWDVTVRASATSITDLDARVFTYAWVTFNSSTIRPTLFYATADGYRYEQSMRGINPGAAVFYGNRAGFLDNGQPLYRDLRGTNQPVNAGFPAGVVAQAPQSPIFFSSIAGSSPNVAQAEKTLGALGVPLVPPTPQLTAPTFVGNITGNRSTEGAGGTFQFNTVNTLTYEIVISRDGTNFDPANVNNRTLTGTALTGSHTVAWNGLDNNAVAFPASLTPYRYRISGRNGEIHFPIIDIEGNASGGPTLRKLNGSGGTTVYFDDRGYVTRGATAVGQLNGHLCGAGHAQVQPTPTHSLIGVDSNAVDGNGRYYRWWAGNNDPNSDCNNNAATYFGSAKALDLWALEKTTEFTQTIEIEPTPANADVGTIVTANTSALPGETVFGTLSFSNNGSTTANNVTYSFVVGTPGSCPAGFSFTLLPAGVTAVYNTTTCAVAFTGLPANLAGSADRNFNFQYTAPANGTVTATATIAAQQDPLPGTNSPNSSSASTLVQTADLAISKTASSPVLRDGPVTFTVRVWNNGPNVVTGAIVNDIVPASVTGVTWTCTAFGTAACGTASGSGNSIGLTVNLGVDPAPTTAANTNYVQIVATGTATAAGALDNTASVQAPGGTSDPTPGNNGATSNSTVQDAADLALVKSDGGLPAVAGQTVEYTLSVTNNGPSVAASVVVTDTLPAGLTFVGASGSGWSCGNAGGVVTCSRATLAVGAAPPITLQLGIPAAYAGANPVSNTASVSTTTIDPTPGNNSGSDTTVVQSGPDAVDDSATTSFGAAVQVAVLGNDAPGSAALDPASVSILALPGNGTFAVNATTGAVTYTPNPGFTGVDSFTYQVCDTNAPSPLCDTATVTIAVAPNALDDSATTPSNTPFNESVAGNDVAPPAAQFTLLTAADGAVTMSPDGSYTYTPNPGFSGVDSFVYRVCLPAPNQLVCDDATVTIAVGPDAGDDLASTPQNTPVSSSVTGNDVAPPGAQYSVPLQPANGTVVMNPDGSYTYMPDPGFSGTDVVGYRVCLPAPNQTQCDTATITISVGANTVTVQDDNDSTAQNTPVTTVVLQNDGVAPNGAPLAPGSVVVVAPSPDGVAVANPDGTITFTPAPNFSGTTSYTYEVCDTTTPTPICAQATVTLTVLANTVTAIDDGDTTAQNTAVTTPVLENDGVPAGGAPIDPGSITIVTPSPSGNAVPNPDGSVTFTPAPGFSGTATYTYQVCDASTPTPVCDTATVEILVGANLVAAVDDSDGTAQNTPVTTAVLGNDSTTGAPFDPGSVTVLSPSPDGIAVANPDGSITFTPATNFSGTTTYTYEACDQSLPTPVCDDATVTITVAPNAVSALNDGDSTAQNTAVTTPVIANDGVAPGGAPLDPGSVTIVQPSPDGTTVANPDGSVTFTPATNFSGTTTYSYSVCDLSVPDPVCDAAIVTISVGANSVAADDDSDSTAQNTPVTTTVLDNDSSTGAALDPGTVAVVAPSSDGNAVANPDGTITFTPDPGFSGTTTYTYEVCDLSMPVPVCGTALVTITVDANVLIAQDDSDSTPQNTPVTTPVINNDDIDPNGAPFDPASVTILVQSPNGIAVANPDGTVTFTPNPNYAGSATYIYQVCDSSVPVPVCDSATVVIDVGANTVNADNDAETTAQNTAVTTPVLDNDSVAAGGAPLDPGSVTVVTPSPDGSAVVNPDGTITFTPNLNFSGVTTYVYAVCDTSVPTPLCAQATVTISVGSNTLDLQNDTDTTPQNTDVTTDVLANDVTTGAALDPASVGIVVQSPNGVATPNADGTITFVPAANFSGTASYTYQVCDLSAPTPACAAALVTVTVQSNVVTAGPDVAATGQNTPVISAVLGNDTVLQPNGAPLDPASLTILAQSPTGTAVANPDGTVTFTPDPTFSGTTSYTYEICDLSTPTPVCDAAVVTVTVGANDVTAGDDIDTTAQNTAVTTNVLGNDTTTSASLDPGSVSITAQSPDGTAVANADGTVTFTPDADFSGTATYSYQVCDVSTPTPVCDSAIVTITVDANIVEAVDDADATAQNTAVTTNVLGNDTTTGASLDPGSVSITAQSPDGTAVADPDGTVTFTPDPDFSGTATYSYQVCDRSTPTPVCDTAVVTITVAANVIEALDDADTTPQNTAVTTTVLGNDTTAGPALDPASVSVTVPSPDGTAVANPDGTITFTPAPNFSGTTSYTYEVCDLSTPTPVCDTAVVTVTVGVNAIAAIDDADATAQNTAVTTAVLGNDTTNGPALDPASVTITVPSPDGTASANPDGTITFVPDPGFSGTATYSYQVCDLSIPTPVCDTAVVTITVGANVIAAVDDADTTAQNTPVTTSVLGNDTTAGTALDPSSVTITAQSLDGTAVANPDGTITFTPNPRFSGTTTYGYQVCDLSTPTPVCDMAIVTVTVGGNAMDAVDDADTTPQNTSVTTSVLGNDTTTGPALDPASVTVVVPSPDGTAVGNPDGTVTFTPAAGFSGTTTYSYRVCDLSKPIPVCDIAVVTIDVGANGIAAVDDADATPQNTPVTTTVLANDTVGSGGAPLDPASVTVTVPSPDGSATPNLDGTITFTPNAGFSGTTTYSYQVCDTSTPTPVCDTAVVTITVGDNIITAADDSDSTPQNTPVTTVVLANDTVGSGGAPLDPASVAITVPSPDGSATPNPDGTITFTPNAGFSGTTTYSYRVCDTSLPTPLCDTAVVTITIQSNSINALNDADATEQNTPVTTSVLGNDTATGAPLDPGSVTITTPSPDGIATPNPDGTITFTPAPGFSGTTTYSYEVCDTSTPTPLCDIAIVTITVGASTVVALNDFDATTQNTPVTTVVLGNDSSSGAPLDPGSITIVAPSPDGTAAANADGTITFTPNAGFSGTTTYSYQVCDTSTPTPVCDTALVTITIPPNAVSALNDNAATPQDTPVEVGVLGNDSTTDAPLDPGSVVVTVPSPDGTATPNPDGSITFTPGPGFSGVTTFSYEVCDTSAPTPVCDTAVVTITVGTSTVVAVDDSDATPQGTPVTTSVLGNDSSSGPALDPGSVAVVAQSGDGVAVANPDGTITFTPNPGFSGTTTYSYQVCDTSTPTPQCDTALVTMVIGSGTVTALDDSDSTPQNTPVTTPVLGNDNSSGPILDTASVTITLTSPDGDLVVNPDGTITFTPNDGFAGVATYAYQVCDTSTPTPVCDIAVVTITVTAGTVDAADDSDSTAQDTAVTTDVLGNDSSTGQPLDPASVTVTVASPDGTTSVNPDGSITFTPNPGFSGTTTYTYSVCDTSTPTPMCDTAVVTIDVSVGVGSADLNVRKTGPASTNPGAQIVFSIQVANLGPDPATAAVLSDPTPAGLEFVSNAGDCTTAFPCALGDMAVGETRTVLATFLVPDDYAGASTIVNIATVTSETPDPTPGDTSSSASTLVESVSPPPVPQPLSIPVDDRWAMLLLGLAMLLLAGARLRRMG